ncbi:MAG: Csu type fimbrial protein [Burkholderiales bacterium]
MTRSFNKRHEVRGSSGVAQRALCTSLLAITLMLTAQSGWGACTLSVLGVIFGSYDTFSNVPLDNAGGSVAVTCDVATPYTVALSPGSGTYTSRSMSGAGSSLSYNLFVDPTRLIVWGDGTPGTSVVAGATTNASHTIYARIPQRQNVPVGVYADTVIVTLSF